jgi:hypothetical protein
MLSGTDRRRRGMEGVEASVWPTTGDIDNETNSLAQTISTFGHDVAWSNTTVTDDVFQTFLRAWDGFVTDFLTWKEGAWFWNPTRRDQLIDYKARFNQLLQRFQALGIGASTDVTPVVGDRPAPDSLDKVMTAVKWGGIALIVVGGLKLASDSGWLRRR